jgi:AAA15 family ATPase/GTPase
VGDGGENNMILQKIDYHEFDNTPNYWALKPFELGKINLLVGKNATGKTRTLKVIDTLSSFILDKGFKTPTNYNIEFMDGSDVYSYILETDGKVMAEKLEINNTVMITRDVTGRGKIFIAQENKKIEFQSPEDKLIISRRDKIQYPYLEKIHEWAGNVRYYSFGSSMNQEYGKPIEDKNVTLDGNSNNSVEVFVVGQLKFEDKFKQNVLLLMNSIGYDLTDIDAQRWQYLGKYIRSEDYTLFASEKDRGTFVVQKDMSQGMFRALSIIIHLSYHVLMRTSVTFIIDDIGEGLDFDRSSRLIRLLIEITEKNDNIQLIMSTNDRFVMNNVPLEYWQVIQRKGGECTVYNYHNSKEKFDEFEYMGLNNFDFLATDYLNSQWEKA